MRKLLPRSIRARLWTAIALLSAAVLGVSLITWIGLQRIDTRMQALHQQSLSRVAQAIDLSKRSSDLATSAPYLLNHRSNFLIDQEGQKLIEVLQRVRSEWPDTDEGVISGQVDVAQITIQMENGIEDLIDASKRLDLIQADVRRVIAILGDTREQISSVIEDPDVQNDQRLIWWTLQSMNADALNAAYANNLIGVGEEQRKYQHQDRQLLLNPLSEKQQGLLDKLQFLVSGSGGIFELRRIELSTNLEAQNALFRIRHDANLVNELAAAYAGRAEAFLSQQRSDSSSAIQYIKITLALVSLISLLLALSAALFVSNYVAHSIGKVSEAMVRLANGDRSTILPRGFENDDEIGDLFRSFRNFRANALRLDRSHKQLNQRNALFEKVFANISYGIAITDANGKITTSNPAFSRILVIEPGVSLGKPLAHWFYDSKFAQSASESFLAVTSRGQIELSAEDGQILELRVSLLPDEGRVWLIADVTESHNLADRLAQIDRIETLGKVAGDTAHDFGNILSTIRTHTHLLNGVTDKKLKTNVAAIENAIEFGSSLTERLLAFARKQNLDPEKVELNSLVNGMVDLVEIGLKENIELRIENSPDPLYVIADPGQLESTLLNLILNSNNAIDKAGAINVTLAKSVNGDASITIEDNGRGMSKEIRTRAIEPFFSTRTDEGGTGLGLSIVYGFIKQTGGNMDIESIQGHGTKVIVTLPISAPKQSNSSTGKSKHALVVDDDKKIRTNIAYMLGEMNFKSILCDNVEEALQRLEAEDFQLVISDFDLGTELSGLQVLSRAAEKMPNATRVLISGKSSLIENQNENYKLIRKPITSDKLETVL